MIDPSLVDGWPPGSSVVVVRLDGGSLERVAEAGDLLERRAWASVSKLAVAYAFGVEREWGLHDFDETIGPRGATVAHLLSHCAGLGLEEADPVVAVATKRVYSNVGYDLAVAAIVDGDDPADWLDHRVFTPLGMRGTRLEGRPAAGVHGSTEDLVTLGVSWLRPDGIAVATRDRMIAPFLPKLDGVVPGFGRFSPCPWGLGPELQGTKHHWMGEWPAESFGHFGQSGALVLLNVNEGIGVVATSSAPFGPWAVGIWPSWTSAMRRRALES